MISANWTGSRSLTRTLYESPLEALFSGAAAQLQAHFLRLDVSLALLALLRRPLHRPPVGALHAEALPCAAGISTPATLGLLQALGTRPEAGAVLG